jgi:hypothetical protein
MSGGANDVSSDLVLLVSVSVLASLALLWVLLWVAGFVRALLPRKISCSSFSRMTSDKTHLWGKKIAHCT